jgi:hypothetical protein
MLYQYYINIVSILYQYYINIISISLPMAFDAEAHGAEEKIAKIEFETKIRSPKFRFDTLRPTASKWVGK